MTDLECQASDTSCAADRPAGRVVAHVDLDAFFTSVEQLLNPRLRGKPVVVGGAANQRGGVASASYEARARGVRVPMPLTRAYRLCPEAHFLPGRHDLYSEYSKRVFAVYEESSPRIEKAGIDEGYLDWTIEQWTARHPRRAVPVHWPLDLAERLRTAVLERVGLNVSIGIGANRLIAKIASKYCKPKGLCHIASGSQRAFLRPMPLSVVPGIGPRSAELLAAGGYTLIAHVQDASPVELADRLGEQWADRLRRIANGEGRETLITSAPPKSVSNERTFHIDCSDFEEVRRTLYGLVEKAAWRLRRAGLKAGACGVKLRTADFQTQTRARSLGYRTDCHQELYLVASELLAEMLRRPKSIRLVGVQLSNLDVTSERQLTLFGQEEYAARRRVDQALDAVRERFGFKTITTAGVLGPKSPVKINH
jgi:DNA polymerase-4